MARRQKVDEEEHNYWMSYSDMMAALFLVFILIISFTLVQYEYAKNKLEKEKQNYEEARNEAKQYKKNMEDSQKKISDLMIVRDKLIKALEDEFGNDLNVTVNSKGAMIMSSSILFDIDKSDLKDTGKKELKKFFPRYMKICLNHEFREHIAEIIIEGHTDDHGIFIKGKIDQNLSYLYNLRLSQERALSVANFCLDENNKILPIEYIIELKKIVTANGRSSSDLIYKNPPINTIVDKSKSRRVEFKFRLKDEEINKQTAELIKKALEKYHIKNKQEQK